DLAEQAPHLDVARVAQPIDRERAAQRRQALALRPREPGARPEARVDALGERVAQARALDVELIALELLLAQGGLPGRREVSPGDVGAEVLEEHRSLAELHAPSEVL